MDMCILNPGSQVDYNTIPIPLKELLEDAIINAREVSQELIKWSNQLKETLPSKSTQLQKNETMSIEERLNKAIFKGESQMIEELIQAMLLKYTPFEIISGPLMESMEKVGEQFSNNKLFLPQVVRAAEVMNRVVELLRPLMGDEKKGGSKGKFLFATVKGDVHDIGKNICATLLRCNGFEVIDLGVMVELDVIVETALRLNPSFIGLSGLIAPSLLEMKRVISACQQVGLKIPIFIGGATTSAEHTALHLANAGEMPILWTEDATQLVILANKLYELEENTISYNDCILQIREQQKKIRMDVENVSPELSSIEEAQLQRVNLYGMTPQSY
jgi:5-methyltetrahydrofolate--homocysteine methyltransferase